MNEEVGQKSSNEAKHVGIWEIIFKGKIIILTITLVMAVVGFIYVNSFYNPGHVNYLVRFEYTSECDYSNLLEESRLVEIQKTKDNFSAISVTRLAKSLKIEEKDSVIELTALKDIFPTEARARNYLKALILSNGEASFESESVVVEIGNGPIIISTIIGLVVGLAISVILVIYLGKKNKDILKRSKDLYQYDGVYRTPFHKQYWNSACKEFKDVKKIVSMALLLSAMLVCKFIVIPSGFENLGLGFGYLFFSVIGLLYGPLAGFVCGGISDVLGYFIAPNGAFFPGYTLNAMLTGMIYGLFFYKTHVSFTKVLLARCCVNFFINAFLGSCWWGIMSSWNLDKIIDYMLLTSLPKNIVYLIPQSMLLFIVLKALLPACVSLRLVKPEISESVSVF